jgi:antirestriction protein ArdC
MPLEVKPEPPDVKMLNSTKNWWRANVPDAVARRKNLGALVVDTGASVTHGGGRAFYRPSTDSIQLPPRGAFIGPSTSTPAKIALFHAVLELRTALQVADLLSRAYILTERAAHARIKGA